MPIALGSFDVTIEHRPDGTIDVRPVQPLAPYPTRLTDRLHYWAGLAPTGFSLLNDPRRWLEDSDLCPDTRRRTLPRPISG